MRGAARSDAVVSAAFVTAAAVEVVARGGPPARTALDLLGAASLFLLALRRSRPVAALLGIAGVEVVFALLTHLAWPGSPIVATLPILALMLATYSVGVHAASRFAPLGVLAPIFVVLVVDLSTLHGWPLVSGILFVSLFVGVLPTSAGRLVGVRADRLERLRRQREAIHREYAAQRERVVLTERLTTAQRLEPALHEGLRQIAFQAANGASAGTLEHLARDLLGQTRREVVALTQVVEPEPAPPSVEPDRVSGIRARTRPWAGLAAALLGGGLAAETLGILQPDVPSWVVVAASAAVALPVAGLVRWPIPMATTTWIASAAYSVSVAPLDKTLSEPGFAFGTSFLVAALSRRPQAVLGLAVCLLGHILTVGFEDLAGQGTVIVASWLAGLVLNEVTWLVDQSRANNIVLEAQSKSQAERETVEVRLRLARELHDVLGHSLTVVALQAGAARRLEQTDPTRAAEVVAGLTAVAQEGLDALEHAGPLTGIADLIERTRAAGLRITADVAAEHLLADAARTPAYRLVQEALTNVLRHAPGARATVVLRQVGDEIEVSVVNTRGSGGPGSPGSGHGLLGLQQRFVDCSGSMSWTPVEAGGFAVCGRLPTQGRRTT